MHHAQRLRRAAPVALTLWLSAAPGCGGAPTSPCGNQAVDAGEECDGDNLATATCTGLGFVGGTLGCSAECTLVTSGCTPEPRCGDGWINAGEECDGQNLGVATCAAWGFDRGTIACDAACRLDTSGCEACGDGTLDAAELCEGVELAGAECTTVGAWAAGTLACGADCMGYDDSGCVGAPSVPAPRSPRNGAYVGSPHVADSLRPTLRWLPATAAGPATAISYEVQLSTDPTFATGVVTATTTASEHRPAADLPVSSAPPVGARYHWRVRACIAATCSSFSPAFYLNLGRSERDLNGDGYADVVVGAPRANGADLDVGAVYIHLGGPGGIVATPSTTLLGAEASGQLGRYVAPVGDLDADGYADLAVGSIVAGAAAGAVYVFHGGPGLALDDTPDGSIPGPAPEASAGRVAAAGDVDGDGFDDLLVAAPGDDTAATNAGAVRWYRGGPGAFDATADVTLLGAAADELLAVGAAGDFDGDGFTDVAVGAPGAAGSVGAVRLYRGGSAGLATTAAWTAAGSRGDDGFGGSVVSGDLDGDSYADLVIGATNSGPVLTGQVFVFRGGPALDPGVDLVLTGAVGGAEFGSGLALGDANGDDYPDLVVGALFEGGLSGGAHVYFGGAQVLATPAADLTGNPSSLYSTCLAFAGDVDGDGVGELLIGASRDDTAATDAGALFLYGGGAGDFDDSADLVLGGAAARDFFGNSCW